MENQNAEDAVNNSQELSQSVKLHIGNLTFELLEAKNTIQSLNQNISALQIQLNKALSNAAK